METIDQDTKNKLKQIVTKIERLESEKKNLADDVTMVYKEAKSMGFDTSILKKIVKIRKMDINKFREEEELLDIYKHALEMV